MAKAPSNQNSVKKERIEQRFESQCASRAVRFFLGMGGVGSAMLGAGVYRQWMEAANAEGDLAKQIFLIAGLGLVGAAFWGVSKRRSAICVGDAGIAMERGELLRIPWYAIKSMQWDEKAAALLVQGISEQGVDERLSIGTKHYSHAVVQILEQAHKRIPVVVKGIKNTGIVPCTKRGTTIRLEPAQLVGKYCAASGKLIAYEPDAHLCTSCGRVYHCDHLPHPCACGGEEALGQPTAVKE